MAAPDTPDAASTLMGRREAITSLAAGLTGVVAIPAGATSPPATQAAGMPNPPSEHLLDDGRRAMLDDLAERLIPGSRAAGVADLLDRVMAVETAESQARFLNALGAFDHEARARHAKGWLELADQERLAILREASALAPSRPEPPGWTPGQPVERPSPPAAPDTLRDHFDRLRDLVGRAYATTEVGMKDLGFAGRMAWPAFPGCTHPGNDHR